jgi:hypothetical protein
MGDRRGGDTETTHPVDRMLLLWATPPDDASAIERFRSVYADP